jgi:hypothetical protein
MILLYIILSIISPSKEPLPGVKVELVGTDKTYYTNLNGQVLIPPNYNLKLSYISYITKTIDKDSIKPFVTLIPR